MQISLRTSSSVDAYIGNREWRDARLSSCPLHPSGGCSFARHGSYGRVTPRGMRVARWYCPEGHQTFSLLPDFLAARLPGLLTSIEDSITVAFSARSMEAAADALRGLDVTLPNAVRWLRRRVRAVREALNAVACVTPAMVADGSTSVSTIALEQGHVLLGLRRSLAPEMLSLIPMPLGFGPSRRGGWPGGGGQQDIGPDGGITPHYAAVIYGIGAPCNTSSIYLPLRPRPPPKTCFGSGAPIAVFEAVAPACTFSGSGASAPIAHNTGWRNAPN